MSQIFNHFFKLIALSLLVLLAACNSEDAFAPAETTAALKRIDIAAALPTTHGVSQLTLAAGNKQPFEATGYYSDGSFRVLTDSNIISWHTSDSDIGFFETPAILTGGHTPGYVSIHAVKRGITSNEVVVNVTAAVITEIIVTPSLVNMAKGQAEQLTAMAIYSDGTSSNITNSASWMSVDSSTAAITSSGMLSGVEAGKTTLTAAKDGITSNEVEVNVSAAVITEIIVTPPPATIAKGQAEQLTATAIYSDGTSSNITSSAIWVSQDPAIAAINSSGVLFGVTAGKTTLTAAKDGITSNEVNVNVTAAALTQITVTPTPLNLAKGQVEQLTATAIYDDGTSSNVTNYANWTSLDTTVATINSNGLLFAANIGKTTLTAVKDGITSNEVDVDITAAVITEIIVTPSPVIAAATKTRQLNAQAIFSDATSLYVTKSVTWQTADPNMATVSSSGLLLGGNIGSTTLTAAKDNITSDVVQVTVLCNFAEACIDVVDIGTGELFTNAPSKKFLDSLGVTITTRVNKENGSTGPSGEFYVFTLAQADQLCQAYNRENLGGRTNWRLPERKDLTQGLYKKFNDMFFARYWPAGMYYWTVTLKESTDMYYGVDLIRGYSSAAQPASSAYTSCVSTPSL
ncbi:MAG: Ig-like domain-containing protein [Enterovibrio sp.]